MNIPIQAETPASARPGGGGRLIDEPRPLSRSALWDLQRQSYDDQGPVAWRAGGVPLQAVSNPVIARAYAEMIVAWLIDRKAAGHADAHVNVLELGAGSGRFGFYLLRQLDRIVSEVPLELPRVRLVMTDLAESNLEALASHPRLRPYIERGVLDMARFDANAPGPLQPMNARWAPGPTAAIANYFFDSIPCDAFQVRDGELFECHVGVRASPSAEVAAGTGAPLERLWLSECLQPVEGARYGEASRDRILDAYRHELGSARFMFPTTAMRCVDWLREISGDELLLLSTDKGNRTAAQLEERSGLHFALHGGTFSVMVNYDALGRYVEDHGGIALIDGRAEQALVHLLAVFGAGDVRAQAQTLWAFQRAFGGFDPRDAQRLLFLARRENPEPSLEYVLRVLRLSESDPKVFLEHHNVFFRCRAEPESWLHEDMIAALHQVGENHFPLAGRDEDVPFALAIAFHTLGELTPALAYYEESLRANGDRAGLRLNMALCHAALGDLGAATACLDRALAIDPEMDDARRLALELIEWKPRTN